MKGSAILLAFAGVAIVAATAISGSSGPSERHAEFQQAVKDAGLEGAEGVTGKYVEGKGWEVRQEPPDGEGWEGWVGYAPLDDTE